MPTHQRKNETDDEFKARLRSYSKSYYWRHRKDQLAKSREWKTVNYEYRLEYQRQYARANKDRMNENHRRWRAINWDRDQATRAAYAARNKQALKVARALGIPVKEARKQLEAGT